MSSKKSQKKKLEESSDSDSGPDDVNPPKKSKTAAKPAPKKASASNSNDEDNMFQLARMRYVNVREFRGKVLIDIREFYEADGELKPGKKGICLNTEQWQALKEKIDDIDDAVKRF
ncbi:activated RNA polymerase II transcriptional coactivator p15 [Parasteatoda tepidariorum]|uniref:activated RNA polymerase II transcriptional coactivator p15 n=1 Tax=Parasteatoda tepidariorum TaxID=114398 RepID=UPI00077FC166|nr:activated RNA polymerase II transcriptional coactivator p15 [Parasteatoda tepidariorum]XP_015917067.1 activated RNA polymerase II transcriptional coactivator p15 [Parasteatoda tepidariorum]XP_042911383.1 activated RNA polymerase II transcriptional coactivator p15 [Parasteatoda tepidariorum]